MYEYTVNGSIDSNHGVHHHELDWIRKSGYSLLHCILHCGIKPYNVIFDASNMLKVADLGVAKI